MEEWLPIIIQLLSGAAGGNIAGKLLKNLDLGTLGNSLAGILGGGIGGQLLGMLGLASGGDGGMDLTNIIASIGGGGAGGGVLMSIIGLVKNIMIKGNT